MTGYNPRIEDLPHDVRAAIQSATYFVLQASEDWGEHIMLASVEDAEAHGIYVIHAGMADRPDVRMMMQAYSLLEALDKIVWLRSVRPGVRLWFSSLEVQKEITHTNIARGVILARGSADPENDADPWSVFARHLVEAEAAGQPLDLDINTSAVIGKIEYRLD